MNMYATQTPEADLDREIEELIGKMVRGNIVDSDVVRLSELQNRRWKLMQPAFRTNGRAGERRFA